MKGEKENIAQHVSPNGFGRNLKDLVALFNQRIDQFTERREGLCELFQEAYTACHDAKEARNGIAHAQFGFSATFDFVIEDLKGKAPGLPIIKPSKDSPTELFAIVETIETARSFAAIIDRPNAWNLGHYGNWFYSPSTLMK